MRFILLAALTALAGGCVMVRSDPAVKAYQPENVGLADFAGTYVNRSSHPASVLDGEWVRTFTGMYPLFHSKAGTTFELRVTAEGRLVALARSPHGIRIERELLIGRDFTIREGVLYFGKTRFSAGDGSPGFGVISDKVEWSLDIDGSLVVINRGGGVGFMAIIPIVAGGNDMAVFPRVADRRNTDDMR